MPADLFARRVQTLRDSWIERRQVQSFASSHDFDSQYQLLLTLHRWAFEAIHDVQEIYRESVSIKLSPAPDGRGAHPAFSMALAGTYSVNFSLQERVRAGTSHWSVAACVISNAPGGIVVPAGPERRNGQWTRGRLEELLLSVLGAYERSRSDRARHSPGI